MAEVEALRAEKNKWSNELAEAKKTIKLSSSQLESLRKSNEKAEAGFKASDAKRLAELDALRERLKKAEALRSEVSARDRKIVQFDKQVGTLSRDIDTQKSSVAALKKEVKDGQSVAKDRERELKKVRQTIQTLEASTARRQAETEKTKKTLQADLADAKRKLSELNKLQKEVTTQKASVVDLRKKLDEKTRQLKRIAELEKSLKSLQSKHGKDVKTRDSEIARLKAMIEKLKRAPKPKPVPKPKAKPKAKPASKPKLTADGKKTTRKDGQDDLKLIFGIGPKIEKMLNGKRVTKFEHIAKWKKAEVTKYSDMLEGFPDRIERDEWVLSAQQILKGTYNWEERRKAREALNKKKPAKKKTSAKKKANKAAVTADGKKTTRKDGKDDLKLIFGIGPKIEKMLNKDGVNEFEDIAAWKKADIAKYSEKLDGFADRIERDEWVLSAKQIIAGTYNWTERQKANQAKAKKKK